MQASSDKTPFPALCIAICAILSGCAADSGSSEKNSANGENFTNAGENSEWIGLQEVDYTRLDFGQDWESQFTPGDGLYEDFDIDNPDGPAEPYWTIVLHTFAGDKTGDAAKNMVTQLPKVAPSLAQAKPHLTENGSMVIFGEYETAEDPALHSELQRVKQITYGGRRLLPRAMLTRIEPPPEALSPLALMSVRVQYPKIDPLYTLQVAVWGDFEGGTLTKKERRRSAVGYTKQLRSRGLPAFYHHDDDKQLSSVTVGLWNSSAVDAATGLLHPDVERVMELFPVHLVNGEELNEPLDMNRPELGTQVQRPKLVLVPK